MLLSLFPMKREKRTLLLPLAQYGLKISKEPLDRLRQLLGEDAVQIIEATLASNRI